MNMPQIFRGRIVQLNFTSIALQTEKGCFQLSVDSTQGLGRGDVVEVRERHVTLLTPNRTLEKTTRWMDRTLNPRRLHGLRIRQKVEAGIREFFNSQNFIETKTPLLVPCPGMEPHIRPFEVHCSPSDLPEPKEESATRLFLPTSPEFAMKRLLIGGLTQIFQICSSFRDEPHSLTHRREFTMLEWYRAFSNDAQIMQDVEALFEFLAFAIHGEPSISYQGQKISVKTPWPRLRVRDLFSEFVQIDLVKNSTREGLAQECLRLGLKPNPTENWDDLYFKIWLNCIEPKLPSDQAVFVTRYPASQAALSVIDQDSDGSSWAKRFEVYAGGIELGNAFEELTDPVEQRRRFVEDMELRTQVYGSSFPKTPLDEEFLNALTEGMPPSGGIAMGVDRIVMLFANEPNIEYTTWL